MLWFGWFGFNSGSALSAGSLAATAMINTQISTAAAAMTWIAYEKKRDGKATTLGVASGAIAGAVAITPACGFLNPMGALVLGLIAGVASAWAVTRKYKFGYDDSLDVVGVHGMGGLIGMLFIGLAATVTANAAGNTQITISDTGIYNIQFSAQLNKTSGGANDIYIWLDKNGTAVANSATAIYLTGNNAKAVAAWNFVVSATAGDYYRLMWLSSSADVQISAQAAAGAVPAVPSVILTVVPVGA
jgi:ammonia channel protein AmtB